MSTTPKTGMEKALEGGKPEPAAKPAPAPAVPPPEAAAPAEGPVLSVTPLARERIRALIEEQGIPENERNLRIFVQAGGCSGFSYGLAFDEAKEEDAVTEADGVRVIVDPRSLPHLKGIVVDFVDTIQEQGFKIHNPNAKSSCGCGESFQT